MTAPQSAPLQGSPPEPLDRPPSRRRRRRRPAWLRSSHALRSAVRAWWYGATADALRQAAADTRRAPGWLTLGFLAVFWACSGFSLAPIAVAAAAWLLLMVVTHWAYRSTRRRIRRWARPAIGVLALATLVVEAGPWAWPLGLGLWLIVAAATDVLRARHRTMATVLAGVARVARVDPNELDVLHETWGSGAELHTAEIAAPTISAADPTVRTRIASAVQWALRNHGRYTVTWPDPTMFVIETTPTLPRDVPERLWTGLPGILLGVTDVETADGYVELHDAQTADTVESLPVALLDPRHERHMLVAGGTGGGKSTFLRGFIARALREGWFPGGAYLFDGKSAADFIPFEGRQGVYLVAREVHEWEQGLKELVAFMRTRYDEEVAYERGITSAPEHPRYLVVIDEIQEIREQIGKDLFDKLIKALAKQMRGSNGRLVVATQRPDAMDSIPGSAKDMLEYVLCFGYVSPIGAREIFGQDWRAIVDEYGTETVPGRGMARVDGRLFRIQSPRLDRIRKNPDVEYLYPPKAGTEEPGETAPAALPVGKWAPAQPVNPAAEHTAQDAPVNKGEQGLEPESVESTEDVPTVPGDRPAGRFRTV